MKSLKYAKHRLDSKAGDVWVIYDPETYENGMVEPVRYNTVRESIVRKVSGWTERHPKELAVIAEIRMEVYLRKKHARFCRERRKSEARLDLMESEKISVVENKP